MTRTLLACLALLCLSAPAYWDTPPNPTADAPAALLRPRTFSELAVAIHDVPRIPTPRPRLLQGLLRRQGLRQYLNVIASIRPKATGSTRMRSNDPNLA